MPRRDIVVIGGSAGSVTPLIEIVKALPQDFAACIFIVVHLQPQSTSKLLSLLHRAGVLEAKFPSDGEVPQPGHIYVAPPDKHLLLENGLIRLSVDAQENGFRPAIDPLFCAAAHAYESRVIGVLLSGLLDDGTLGLAAVKRHGGITVVQNPDDAEFSSMPQSAIDHIKIDHIRSQVELAALLVELTSETDVAPIPREEESSRSTRKT
jgi:two-component system chemotaxis response regulator CheB